MRSDIRRLSGVVLALLSIASARGAAPASAFTNRVLSSATAAAPANDAFGTAQRIDGPNGQLQGANAGATKELLEPNHAGEPGGASVWYRWTAPKAGTVILDTDGSDFDTLLAVYTGLSVGLLGEAASNDDDIVSFPRSRLVLPAAADTTYHIAVDGYGGATGVIQLRWTLTTGPPANDAFGDAMALSGSGDRRVTTNVLATKEAGEPAHAGRGGGASVWYRWTAPSRGIARFDTSGSDFDTLLAVYVGNAVGALLEVASNDDEPSIFPRSALMFETVAGTTYHIAVDGYDGAVGRIELSWQLEAHTGVSVVGHTWFASGALTLSGPSGSVVSAFATGAAPDTTFRLVTSPAQQDERHRCTSDVIPVNPTVRYSNGRGFVATTSGRIERPAGMWDVCFLSLDGSTVAAPVRFEIVG